MNPGSERTTRHERALALFTAAVRLAPAEQGEFLARECPDDGLRAEVAALLAVERDRLRPSSDVPVEDPLPSRIGRYRVLRRIGRGGMGSVYEGEQDHPRRRVAIKVVHPGSSVASFLRRFEFEVEILARLNHPGIAHIIEAGHFEDRGAVQPFFAMEFVEGVPITEYVATRALDSSARLALFCEICDAVQHAHQRGVVHRDLKPANVLVDVEGHPKILDFGIARLTDEQEGTDRNTIAGELLGTVAYMSPEQAAGDTNLIDTRSDVYSLGLMLYEILTGKLPYEVSPQRVHAAIRTIIEVEPKSLVANDPGVDRDLATVALKAVEKDRDRRYQSAADLAADVRRFLSHEPIVARPATTTYVLKKFARRNPLLVGSVVAAAVLVTTALVVALFALADAREARAAESTAREHAEREAAAVTAMNKFMLRDMIEAVSPFRSGRDTRLVDMLDAAIPRIDTTFADQPYIRDTVRAAIGGTYRELGLIKESEKLLRESLPGLERELGPTHERCLEAKYQLMLCLSAPEDPQALVLADELYEHYLKSRGPRDELTLRMQGDRGALLAMFGQRERGLSEMRAALSTCREVLGPEHSRTTAAMRKLGEGLSRAGGFAEAEELVREYLELASKVRPPGDPEFLSAQASLARILLDLGRIEEAEARTRAVLETTTAVYGPQGYFTLNAKAELASLLNDTDRAAQATPLCAELCAASEAAYGRLHYLSLFYRGEYAINLRKTGRIEEAEREARAALEGRLELFGEVHEDVAVAHQTLSSVLFDKKDFAGADEHLTRAIAIARATFGTKHPIFADMLFNSGTLLLQRREYARAESTYRELIALDTELRGPEHSFVAGGRSQLGRTLVGQGCLEEGATELAASIAIRRKATQEGKGVFFETCTQLGSALLDLGRYAEAESALIEAWNGFWALNDGRRLARSGVAEKLVALYERIGWTSEADLYRVYVEAR